MYQVTHKGDKIDDPPITFWVKRLGNSQEAVTLHPGDIGSLDLVDRDDPEVLEHERAGRIEIHEMTPEGQEVPAKVTKPKRSRRSKSA